jgi:hypothetical protein
MVSDVKPARRTVLPALALASCLVSTAPAGAAAPVVRRCAQAGTKKVLTTPALRVVSVRVDTVSKKNQAHIVGRDFYGCAGATGAAHKIGFIYKDYATTGSVKGMTAVDSGLTSFGQTAGTFIITRTRESDLSGNFAERTYRVVDVATGRKYTFFHQLSGEEESHDPAPPVTQRLDDSGRLAAILSSPDDEGYADPPVGSSEVVAFSATGKRTVLDVAPIAAIPKASLTLSEGAVGWTNAGKAKTAPAPAS